MTVSYQGGDLYNIYIDSRYLQLSKREIDLIQTYNFDTNLPTKSTEDLEEELDDAVLDLQATEHANQKALNLLWGILESDHHLTEDLQYDIRQIIEEL